MYNVTQGWSKTHSKNALNWMYSKEIYLNSELVSRTIRKQQQMLAFQMFETKLQEP